MQKDKKLTKSFLKKILILILFATFSYVAYVTISKNISTQTISSQVITKEELFRSAKVGLLPKEIKGNIITLKKLDKKYFHDYHKMFSDTVRKNIEYPSKITFEFSKNMLRYDMQQERAGKMIIYFIFDNKDNKLIGSIEIKDKNIEDPGQFSIWINENFWSEGRAKEAINIISNIYFKYKNEDEYEANVRLWNKRSYKALTKAGFKDVDRFYEDGEPTRYILKMYNTSENIKNNNPNNKKQGEKNMSNKKNILFILIPNFRDEEFSVPFNMLYENGYTLDVAGVETGEVIGANGYKHKADLLLDTLTHKNLEKYDALVIPGGPGSTTYLWNNPKVQEIIEFFNEQGKIVATICYACVAAAQSGILKDKKATVYPTSEARKIFEKCNVNFDNKGVVVLEDEKIITAKGPKFSNEFGQAIIDMLTLR